MISKKELMIRICQLEDNVNYILDKIEKKPKVKKTVKKVKKNENR